MKKRWMIGFAAAAALCLAACGPAAPEEFRNPGDSLGGGGTVEELPQAGDSSLPAGVKEAAEAAAEGGFTIGESVPLPADGKIVAAGNYLCSGERAGKISVQAAGVQLILENASLTNDKKVIESDYPLTVTLCGENTLANTDAAEAKNAIDVEGLLRFAGDGSLKIVSQKNAVKADCIAVLNAALELEAEGDGLHAEIAADDDLTAAPAFSYAAGYVLLDGAKVKANVKGDGIQADSFVYIKGGSTADITTNGGAPQKITEISSDNGDGKGIKAGPRDWGADDRELTAAGYLIAVESGTLTLNTNDDALHSDGDLSISGGTLRIAAGDDAVHCEGLATISGGDTVIERCYEGVEGAKVEITGGTLSVTSADDGINAADGTQAIPGRPNENCHVIIGGGEIRVSAEGDGVDSNGVILISGGKLFVNGPASGDNTALDADGGIAVNGGYVFAVGALGMVKTPASNSAQCVLSFASLKNISAGTYLILADEKGEIFSYQTEKECRSVIVSCPELQMGKSYSLYGGEQLLTDFTVSGVITSVGTSAQPGEPGSRPGGFGRH